MPNDPLEIDGTEMTAIERAPRPLPAINTSMGLLERAVERGADLATIEKLMELQERLERNQARKAFDAAMAAFKANPPDLYKNKRVHFTSQKGTTDYKHATLDEVAINIGSALSPHGLSFRWNVEQAAGRIRVTCILSHSAGHFEQVQMEGGADATGNKNDIQQVGSTVTYLQRYTLLAITGMAVKDQDNDGGSVSKGLPAGTIAEQCEWIENAKDTDELKKLYLAAIAMAEKANDKNATAAFSQSKNRRYKELA